MIRDPSDGTVKPAIKPAIETKTSGLQTDKLKADDLERLEKSRDWLREYFNRASEQADSGLRSPDSGEGWK